MIKILQTSLNEMFKDQDLNSCEPFLTERFDNTKTVFA